MSHEDDCGVLENSLRGGDGLREVEAITKSQSDTPAIDVTVQEAYGILGRKMFVDN